MKDRKEIKEKLIQTTIEEIERVGLSKVTVRALSKAAGVNVAAINYYFGSKSNLLQEAQEQTLNHLLGDLQEMLEKTEIEPRQQLHEMLSYLFEGALRYPNITRSHIYDMFIEGSELGGLSSGMAPVVAHIAGLLETTSGLSKKLAFQRSVQVFSAVLFPSLLQSFFASSEVHDTFESRQMYIEEVINSAFRPAS